MNDSVSAVIPSRSIAPSSSIRVLSSPLSPEDLPLKKNKSNMSSRENSVDVLGDESGDNQSLGLDHSQTHTLTLPPATLQQLPELMKQTIHADDSIDIRGDLRA